jgi:hypothetical protein
MSPSERKLDKLEAVVIGIKRVAEPLGSSLPYAFDLVLDWATLVVEERSKKPAELSMLRRLSLMLE